MSQAALGAVSATPRDSLRAADRASNAAATMLALALPGDTVLYLLLPLNAAAFGVSLPEAGLLLAANRMVRIIGYGWVARGYQRHGPRAACRAAVVAAAVATLGYACLSGVWALLLARLLWGLAFATLNVATQALVTAERSGINRRSGRSRAIISAGPMAFLIIGALLAEWAGPRPVFVLLSLAALLAVPVGRLVPSGRGAAVRSASRFALPSRLDLWSFMQGLTLDGLFVVGLSLLAARSLPGAAALAAGAALSLRYLSEIVLGPVGGAAAQRFGAAPMLVLASVLSAGGLAVIGLGWFWPGVLVVVVLRGILQPLPAPVVAESRPGAARVAALAQLATWRDIGAGLGPLVAGILLPAAPPGLVYGGAALLMAGAALIAAPRRAAPP